MPKNKAPTSPPAFAGFLNERQLATTLGVSLSWIQHDRRKARIVPYIRVGGRILYDLAAVRQALLARQEGGAA